MHRFIACLTLIVLLGSCAGQRAVVARPPELDGLFNRLQTAQSDEEARMIEVAIRHAWANSGRPRIDALMANAIQAMHSGDYPVALGVLDRVTADAPDYTEGWNLRATVHYLDDDYAEAVNDIQRVLALEPRHFGALAGLGRIMLELENKKAALWAFDHALSINPHLVEVRDEAAQIREELAGLPI